jgi:ABC-type spermidine/putrescine transport system permease subunit II
MGASVVQSSVVRHGISVRRRSPSRLMGGIIVAVVVAFVVFVGVVPAWALGRRDWGPSDVASAIQASTSVFGAIVGGVALVAAVLAYADSQQRRS